MGYVDKVLLLTFVFYVIILFVISIINIFLINNPRINRIKRWKEYSLCFQLIIFIIAQFINLLNNEL